MFPAPAPVSSGQASCKIASNGILASPAAIVAPISETTSALQNQQQQRITSPTLDSIRTVQSGPIPTTSVTNSNVSSIRPFQKNYYTNSSPMYSNDIVINSVSNQNFVSQQLPQRPPLFSVSSLINMPTSPAPKSLDFMNLKPSGPNTAMVVVPQVANGLVGPASVSMPPNIVVPILEPQSQQHETHSAQVSKEIFSACKTGDLIKLKKYLTPANVNIRDTMGGRSTVSFCVEMIFWD